MKKIVAMIVAAMMALSFSMVAVAAEEKTAEKPAARTEGAHPAILRLARRQQDGTAGYAPRSRRARRRDAGDLRRCPPSEMGRNFLTRVKLRHREAVDGGFESVSHFSGLASIQFGLSCSQGCQHRRRAGITLSGGGLAGFADDFVEAHEFKLPDECS